MEDRRLRGPLPVRVLSCGELGRLADRLYRPEQLDGPYACPKCAAPVVPCDACAQPALCGDVWCAACQPDEDLPAAGRPG